MERCTVHYEDTLLATVDANIRLTEPDTTIGKATMMAKDLRKLLENSADIHKANIFLDLNDQLVPSS